ncbi:MAG TPA: type II secretion system protein [Terriglobales bacterium]|jgi:prepilin-type N-terminal cleavage/methylation domain-containing protein|nr:type II secretion system protein [Terriglobales bacterium]
MSKRRMRGFSLVEMMIVIVVLLIACAVSFMTLQPALKQTRVTSAYNFALGALRQAREDAVANRRVYMVTFSNAASPNTITITQSDTGVVKATYNLPTDIVFGTQTGFPVSQTTAPTTPDGFGIGNTGIDLDQGVAGGVKTAIYFYPDGSGQDVNNNINNGVLYVGRAADINSWRAITIWGATGRLRGWRLYPNGANYYWRQM